MDLRPIFPSFCPWDFWTHGVISWSASSSPKSMGLSDIWRWVTRGRIPKVSIRDFETGPSWVENWGERRVEIGLIRARWWATSLNFVLVPVIFPGKPPERAQGRLSGLTRAYTFIQSEKFQVLFYARLNGNFSMNAVIFSHFSYFFGCVLYSCAGQIFEILRSLWQCLWAVTGKTWHFFTVYPNQVLIFDFSSFGVLKVWFL